MALLVYLLAALVFYVVAVATALALFVLVLPAFEITRSFVFGSKRAILMRDYCLSVIQGACTLVLFTVALRWLRTEPTLAMLVLPIGVFIVNRCRRLTVSQRNQVTYAMRLQHDGIEFDSGFYRPIRIAEMLGQITGVFGAAWSLGLALH